MKETVPIGIIIQTDVKPNSKYKIMGTGIVKKWEEGYYFRWGPKPHRSRH